MNKTIKKTKKQQVTNRSTITIKSGTYYYKKSNNTDFGTTFEFIYVTKTGTSPLNYFPELLNYSKTIIGKTPAEIKAYNLDRYTVKIANGKFTVVKDSLSVKTADTLRDIVERIIKDENFERLTNDLAKKFNKAFPVTASFFESLEKDETLFSFLKEESQKKLVENAQAFLNKTEETLAKLDAEEEAILKKVDEVLDKAKKEIANETPEKAEEFVSKFLEEKKTEKL